MCSGGTFWETFLVLSQFLPRLPAPLLFFWADHVFLPFPFFVFPPVRFLLFPLSVFFCSRRFPPVFFPSCLFPSVFFFPLLFAFFRSRPCSSLSHPFSSVRIRVLLSPSVFLTSLPFSLFPVNFPLLLSVFVASPLFSSVPIRFSSVPANFLLIPSVFFHSRLFSSIPVRFLPLSSVFFCPRPFLAVAICFLPPLPLPPLGFLPIPSVFFNCSFIPFLFLPFPSVFFGSLPFYLSPVRLSVTQLRLCSVAPTTRKNRNPARNQNQFPGQVGLQAHSPCRTSDNFAYADALDILDLDVISCRAT